MCAAPAFQAKLFGRSSDGDTEVIKLDHLQRLARVWELPKASKVFWRENSTFKTICRTLKNHITAMDPSQRLGAKPKNLKSLLRPYAGDTFGTRGDYAGAAIYLSRMPIKRAAPTTAAADATSNPSVVVVAMISEVPPGAEHVQAKDNASTALCALAAQVRALLACGRRGMLTGGTRGAQEGLRHALVVGGAIGALVRLWAESRDAGEKSRCASALCNLSGAAGHGAIIAEGALPAVIALCTLEDKEGLELAARTLRMMSQHDDNCSPMTVGGVVFQLAAITARTDEPAQGICVDILCDLAAFKPNLPSMIEDDAIESLIAVARTSKRESTLR